MTLMLGFGAAAIALAAIGIYGVIAYSAAQRRNEMAIRLALGATSQNVFWLTVRQGRTLALSGDDWRHRRVLLRASGVELAVRGPRV